MENLPDLPLNLKAAGAAAELVGDQRDGGPPVGPPEGLGRAVGPLLWGLDRPEDVFVRSLDYCLIRRLFFVDNKRAQVSHVKKLTIK